MEPLANGWMDNTMQFPCDLHVSPFPISSERNIQSVFSRKDEDPQRYVY